jgi:predicted metal-dependent peptidase
MSYEEVYDDLYKNAEKIDINELIQKLLDDHMEDENDSDSDSKGRDGNNRVKRPRLTDEEKAAIRDEIKEAMLSAAQTCDAGNIPAGVKRIIQDLTEPKMNWRELIRQQIESTVKSDFTWLRTSRKGWDMDAVMPGMKTQEAIDICVMIDMSGSISDSQGRDFVSEVKGIMETFEDYRIHIGCFDTEVYNMQVFTSDNLEDISEYRLDGGGGTDFDCFFDYFKKEDIEPKKLVVFTDGYPGGSWGDPNYCDTVWIIHGDKNPDPPFGTFALYDEN